MFHRFLKAALCLALLIQGFVFLAPWFWFFELFTHYAVYYVFIAATLGVLALFSRHFKSSLIWAVLLCINFAQFAPYLLSKKPSDTNPTSSTLKVIAQNFYYEDTDVDQFLSKVRAEEADVIIVVEASDLWKTAKEKLRTDYPYFHLTHITGVHGLFIASRIPGTFKEVPLGIQTGLVFTPDTLDYQIMGVHPDAPLTPSWAKDRNEQFKEIARLTETSPVPLIVMGDFNCTPWSPYFRTLLEDSGLEDARLGFGLIPTWNAHRPLFTLPIDHALVSPEIEVKNFKTLDPIDSDHLGIVLTVAL
jgi:endonuclease/exonuclease/phosphatase (EEP) superfamily protein YafD